MTSPDPVASEALAACPFCAGPARILTAHMNGLYSAACDECGSEGSRVWGKRAAIAAWNRRAAPAAPAVGDIALDPETDAFLDEIILGFGGEIAATERAQNGQNLRVVLALARNKLNESAQKIAKLEAELARVEPAQVVVDGRNISWPLQHHVKRSAYDAMVAERDAARAELSLLRQAGQVISKSQARRVTEGAGDEVERVAEALARYEHIAHGEDAGPDWTWESVHDQSRTEYLGMAQAAIAAMRGEKGAG